MPTPTARAALAAALVLLTLPAVALADEPLQRCGMPLPGGVSQFLGPAA